MAKSPNEPEILQVPAEVSQDPTTGEWVATSLKTPRLSVKSMESGHAVRHLERQLSAKLGRPVEIVEKLKLPKPLADRVAAYQERNAKIAELTREKEQDFMPLV